jgi:hypothetical protein
MAPPTEAYLTPPDCPAGVKLAAWSGRSHRHVARWRRCLRRVRHLFG